MITGKYLKIIFFAILLYSVIIVCWAKNFEMYTSIGYDGFLVPDCWIPVFIKVNQPVKNGRIEIIRMNIDTKFPAVESFNYDNMHQLECPVLIDEKINFLLIRLYEDNQLLTEKKIDLKEKIFPGHLILVNNINSSIRNAISNCLFPVEPVKVISFKPEELPALGLDYDCINYIIMDDPGLLITPAQLTALKIWISGGGKIILFNLLEYSQSFISFFTESESINKNPESFSMKIGLGNIIGYSQSMDKLKWSKSSSAWNKLLEIKPYGQKFRFTSDISYINNYDDLKITRTNRYRFFYKNKIKDKNNYNYILLICFSIWIAGFLLILLLKKKKFIFLICFTFLIIILSIFLAIKIDKKWKRGITANTQMIILPGNNSVLTNCNIEFFDVDSDLDLKANYSPWGINISIGKNENANIRPMFDKATKLFHKNLYPEFTIQKASPFLMNITGYQSIEVLNNSKVFPFLENLQNGNINLNNIKTNFETNVILIKSNSNENLFFTWDYNNQNWKIEEKISEVFNKNLTWINHLKNIDPSINWIIGYSNIPNLKLILQNSISNEVLWALPVINSGNEGNL